jgi:hypothetical protein
MDFLKSHLPGEDTPQARRPDALAGEAQQELLGLIEDYQQGLLRLIVPLTWLHTGSGIKRTAIRRRSGCTSRSTYIPTPRS